MLRGPTEYGDIHREALAYARGMNAAIESIDALKVDVLKATMFDTRWSSPGGPWHRSQ